MRLAGLQSLCGAQVVFAPRPDHPRGRPSILEPLIAKLSFKKMKFNFEIIEGLPKCRQSSGWRGRGRPRDCRRDAGATKSSLGPTGRVLNAKCQLLIANCCLATDWAFSTAGGTRL